MNYRVNVTYAELDLIARLGRQLEVDHVPALGMPYRFNASDVRDCGVSVLIIARARAWDFDGQRVTRSDHAGEISIMPFSIEATPLALRIERLGEVYGTPEFEVHTTDGGVWSKRMWGGHPEWANGPWFPRWFIEVVLPALHLRAVTKFSDRFFKGAAVAKVVRAIAQSPERIAALEAAHRVGGVDAVRESIVGDDAAGATALRL